MIQILLIGIGAGAASALLFASVSSGSAIALPLFALSALPIMIATIGWGRVIGLIAVLLAGLSLALLLNLTVAVVFMIVFGIPGYALAYAAMLSRNDAADSTAGTATEWYPPGRLIVWAAAIATLLAVISILQYGSTFETYRAGVAAVVEVAIKQRPEVLDPASLKKLGIKSTAEFTEMMIVLIPQWAAVFFLVVILFNLWLAGTITRISGRLGRPWPDLATISYPPAVLIVFGIVLVLSFVASGMPGLLVGIVLAVLTLSFSILGFAVLHSITRGVAGRPLLLGLAWASTTVGLPVLIAAVLGITDAIFDLRGRIAARRPPTPTII